MCKRICPTCFNEIIYKDKYYYNSSVIKNRGCRSCSKKGKNNPRYKKLPWNKGLTKKESEKLRGGGWNKGLTKEIDIRVGHSLETRKKISNSNKGKKHSKEWVENFSKATSGVNHYLYGKERTEEYKKKMRLLTLERIKQNKLNGNQLYPNYNPKGCQYFNNLMEQTNTYIQHAQNDGEFYIKELGYWVDGYDKENNIIYEYDEKYHNRQKDKDLRRQREIEKFLKCKFIRIRDDDRE